MSVSVSAVARLQIRDQPAPPGSISAKICAPIASYS
jgi:hypothetical protein